MFVPFALTLLMVGDFADRTLTYIAKKSRQISQAESKNPVGGKESSAVQVETGLHSVPKESHNNDVFHTDSGYVSGGYEGVKESEQVSYTRKRKPKPPTEDLLVVRVPRVLGVIHTYTGHA